MEKIKNIKSKKYLIFGTFLLAGIGFMMDNQNKKEDLYPELKKIVKENAELRKRIEIIEKLLKGESRGDLSGEKLNISGKGGSPGIMWVSPRMGWEVDYTNNQIYAVDNTGTGYTMNVGIGTNAPQSRFHLVGDFYNQGFTGAQNNYDPGVPAWTNVTTQTITTHGTGEDGSVVLIFAHVQERTDGGYVDMFIRVIRDNSVVVGIANGGGFYDIWSSTSAYFGATLVSYDNPPPGTHTYTLQIESVFGQPYGYNFFVIELKR